MQYIRNVFLASMLCLTLVKQLEQSTVRQEVMAISMWEEGDRRQEAGGRRQEAGGVRVAS